MISVQCFTEILLLLICRLKISWKNSGKISLFGAGYSKNSGQYLKFFYGLFEKSCSLVYSILRTKNFYQNIL